MMSTITHARNHLPHYGLENSSTDKGNSDRQDAFIFPPESGPHIAEILVFPSACSMPSQLLEGSRAEIMTLAKAISGFEPVRLFVRPEEVHLAQSLLDKTSSSGSDHPIELIKCAANHPWVRDNGPVYVSAQPKAHSGIGVSEPVNQRYAIDFNFNEWGGKAPINTTDAQAQMSQVWGQSWPVLSEEALSENAQLASRIIRNDATPSQAKVVRSPITLEGGGLIVDGDGTLLITESCVICPVRNPGWSKTRIEIELKRLLGVEKVIWFKGCRGADITDAHVDDLARFVAPGVLVVTRPPENDDVWKEVMDDIRCVLRKETDARGRSFEIHELEEPSMEFISESTDEEPQASYTNFYFVNGGIILPAFGDAEEDCAALDKLTALAPSRKVCQVYIHALPLSGGGIHCVTQQVPTY